MRAIRLFLALAMVALILGGAQGSSDFILYVASTSPNADIKLPFGYSKPTISLEIDWGDSSAGNYTSATYDAGYACWMISHTYSAIGTYQIRLGRHGNGPIWLSQFGWGGASWAGWKSLPFISLLNVTSFGDLGISSLGLCFYRLPTNAGVPQDIPSTVTDTTFMFREATSFNQPIGGWNFSKVTKASGMFSSATAFNQPIGNWDVSSVTLMTSMFLDATSFDQPLHQWCVSQIPNEPTEFAFRAPLASGNKPVWGACPTAPLLPLVAPPRDASITDHLLSPIVAVRAIPTVNNMQASSATPTDSPTGSPTAKSPSTIAYEYSQKKKENQEIAYIVVGSISGLVGLIAALKNLLCSSTAYPKNWRDLVEYEDVGLPPRTVFVTQDEAFRESLALYGLEYGCFSGLAHRWKANTKIRSCIGRLFQFGKVHLPRIVCNIVTKNCSSSIQTLQASGVIAMYKLGEPDETEYVLLKGCHLQYLQAIADDLFCPPKNEYFMEAHMKLVCNDQQWNGRRVTIYFAKSRSEFLQRVGGREADWDIFALPFALLSLFSLGGAIVAMILVVTEPVMRFNLEAGVTFLLIGLSLVLLIAWAMLRFGAGFCLSKRLCARLYKRRMRSVNPHEVVIRDSREVDKKKEYLPGGLFQLDEVEVLSPNFVQGLFADRAEGIMDP